MFSDNISLSIKSIITFIMAIVLPVSAFAQTMQEMYQESYLMAKKHERALTQTVEEVSDSYLSLADTAIGISNAALDHCESNGKPNGKKVRQNQYISKAIEILQFSINENDQSLKSIARKQRALNENKNDACGDDVSSLTPSQYLHCANESAESNVGIEIGQKSSEFSHRFVEFAESIIKFKSCTDKNKQAFQWQAKTIMETSENISEAEKSFYRTLNKFLDTSLAQ